MLDSSGSPFDFAAVPSAFFDPSVAREDLRGMLHVILGATVLLIRTEGAGRGVRVVVGRRGKEQVCGA